MSLDVLSSSWHTGKMTKYKEYFLKMLEQNKELFDSFRITHDKYALNPEAMQKAFNDEGEKIRTIVNDYENKLCSQSEVGGYSSFVGKLAEKFRAEVKREFLKIDHIGIITKTPKVTADPALEFTSDDKFFIKKINLS